MAGEVAVADCTFGSPCSPWAIGLRSPVPPWQTMSTNHFPANRLLPGEMWTGQVAYRSHTKYWAQPDFDFDDLDDEEAESL